MINCGCNSISERAAIGMKVGELATNFPALSIPAEHSVMVNGIQVSPDYEIRAGDDVWLLKASGSQG